MRKLLFLLFPVLLPVVWAGTPKVPENLVLVEGGVFKNAKSNYFGKDVTVSSFYIGKCEVTQKEWTDVMGSNPSKFQGDTLPVETVSWYDCIEYCNQRSLKEGLKPYYIIDKKVQDPNNHTVVDDVKWVVTIDPGSKGYRLPTEIEWEYAASGGQLSKNYTYSGGDDLEQVAWFWQNSGDKELTGSWSWPVLEKNHNRTQPVASKAPNELGLYDMSGNVREWCWDWFGDLTNNGVPPKQSMLEAGRVWKGGGWMGGDFCCTPSFRVGLEANSRGPDQGLRVCRSL